MSTSSIAGYFPWERMKVTGHRASPEGRTGWVRLEPDRRFIPRCHACGQIGTVTIIARVPHP